MKDVLEAGATLVKRAEGFIFTEGPVYDFETDILYFSDIPANRIHRFYPATNTVDLFREPTGEANGNTFDSSRRLITCEGGARRVSRTEADGQIVTLAFAYENKRLNAPNDVVVKSDGTIYFTDPNFGDKATEELGFYGVYRIDRLGNLTLLADDFTAPNGLAFSPDESLLYVDDSREMNIRVFDVTAEGLTTNGRVFAETPSHGKPGVPDGLKVDKAGRVYCTSAGGVWVIAPDGTALGIIETPEVSANVAFGDTDNKTLYITANTGLYSIRLTTEGATQPGR